MARSKFSMDRMEATDAGQWQLKNDKVFSSYSQVPAGDTVANLAGFPDRASIWMPRTHFMPEVGWMLVVLFICHANSNKFTLLTGPD